MPIIGVIGSQNTKGFLNPLAPTIGTATDVGTARAYNNGAATVTFTANPAGSPATSFTATSSPGGFTATGSSSPLTVTGLQSNTAYTFIVKGTNVVGDSPNSASSNSITATTVPETLTIGTATKNTSNTGTVNVAFTTNGTGGKAISGYNVSATPAGFGSGFSSPIQVSGLTPGSSYTFTATATNANGTSTASSASNSVAASQYTCPSGGSVSGSNCTYSASSGTSYTCPSDCGQGNSLVAGCYYNEGQLVGNKQGCSFFDNSNQGSVICWRTGYYPNCYGGGCRIFCTSSSYYYCPSGGNVSGSNCIYSATIG